MLPASVLDKLELCSSLLWLVFFVHEITTVCHDKLLIQSIGDIQQAQGFLRFCMNSTHVRPLRVVYIHWSVLHADPRDKNRREVMGNGEMHI
jgi:hypothetical protein